VRVPKLVVCKSSRCRILYSRRTFGFDRDEYRTQETVSELPGEATNQMWLEDVLATQSGQSLADVVFMCVASAEQYSCGQLVKVSEGRNLRVVYIHT
jgi:hypothetical protein